MNDIQLYLLASKLLISHPEDWTKLYGARDVDDNSCSVNAEAAARWCAAGAVTACDDDSVFGLQIDAINHLNRAARRLGCRATNQSYPMIVLNDSSSHDKVMKMFDLAIEFAARSKPTYTSQKSK